MFGIKFLTNILILNYKNGKDNYRFFIYRVTHKESNLNDDLKKVEIGKLFKMYIKGTLNVY